MYSTSLKIKLQSNPVPSSVRLEMDLESQIRIIRAALLVSDAYIQTLTLAVLQALVTSGMYQFLQHGKAPWSGCYSPCISLTRKLSDRAQILPPGAQFLVG